LVCCASMPVAAMESVRMDQFLVLMAWGQPTRLSLSIADLRMSFMLWERFWLV